MSDWLTELTSQHIRDLSPYESARRLFATSKGQQRVWMNANEAPESSTYSVTSDLLNRYPDCQPESVLSGYADYVGLDISQIVVTRGADEGIELLIRAFCAPGKDSVLICPPTYGMYAISANTFNVDVEKVCLHDDFTVNVPAICQHSDNVSLVFLCSPNNPTGTLISTANIETILKAYQGKGIVAVDEAYIEFSAASTQSALLAKYDNLVILRTLSKGFALAGIRCGFVLSSAAIKHVLLKVIAPYPVPDPVAQIAAQALTKRGLDVMHARVSELSAELDSLSKELNEISDIELVGQRCGNFVLFKSPKNPELMLYLVANNVLIRDQSKQVMLDHCLRISIGTPAQNKQLLDLIQSFFAPQNPAQSANNEAL